MSRRPKLYDYNGKRLSLDELCAMPEVNIHGITRQCFTSREKDNPGMPLVDIFKIPTYYVSRPARKVSHISDENQLRKLETFKEIGDREDEFRRSKIYMDN